jgi:hypothetical protein
VPDPGMPVSDLHCYARGVFLILEDGSVADYDLDLLADVLAVQDRELAARSAEAGAVQDPDAFGIFDRMEHATGLGFVACQTYMTSTYAQAGVRKSEALRLGPQHSSGESVVQAITHAANYWKHRDEWVLDGDGRREERIRAAFDRIGFPVDTDYPLSGILTELVSPASPAFAPLVAVFADWRTAVVRHADASGSSS